MNYYRQDHVRPTVKRKTENLDRKNKFATVDHYANEKLLTTLSFKC